jgi:hypothetical protein
LDRGIEERGIEEGLPVGVRIARDRHDPGETTLASKRPARRLNPTVVSWAAILRHASNGEACRQSSTGRKQMSVGVHPLVENADDLDTESANAVVHAVMPNLKASVTFANMAAIDSELGIFRKSRDALV